MEVSEVRLVWHECINKARFPELFALQADEHSDPSRSAARMPHPLLPAMATALQLQRWSTPTAAVTYSDFGGTPWGGCLAITLLLRRSVLVDFVSEWYLLLTLPACCSAGWPAAATGVHCPAQSVVLRDMCSLRAHQQRQVRQQSHHPAVEAPGCTPAVRLGITYLWCINAASRMRGKRYSSRWPPVMDGVCEGNALGTLCSIAGKCIAWCHCNWMSACCLMATQF
jgi:hypothetical protein